VQNANREKTKIEHEVCDAVPPHDLHDFFVDQRMIYTSNFSPFKPHQLSSSTSGFINHNNITNL